MRQTKPMVYVSGPYTNPDPVENTNRAVNFGTKLLDASLVVPYIPHLSLLWHMITPRPYDTWLDIDIDVINHCHSLIRLDGDSSGADREVAYANELGITIFFQNGQDDDALVDEVHKWAASWCFSHY